MAKKEKTMNIKRKDKYTFNEVLDIAMSLKLIEYTDVKKKTVDVTGTFVENYGMQHIPAMMVNQSLKAKSEQEYKVSDVMLVTYVDNILSEIKQPDNEALGGGLYNLFKNFPRKSLTSHQKLCTLV